ncbi:MAG: sulfotransferase [Spartobacteria bacterium]
MGPDFLCVGAQKAGTGWLYEQLRSHPDFWMPPLKELHYFDRLGRARLERKSDRLRIARQNARDQRDIQFVERMEKLRSQETVDFDGYAALFEPKGALISGDITPGYSTLPDAMAGRITERFPSMKIIFLARDPVERAWSQLSMWVRHGVIAPFAENDFDAVTQHLQRPEVMLRSHLTTIVARWRHCVAHDSFGLYFFDDLKRDAAEVRSGIVQFLGGDATKPSGALAVDHNPKGIKEKLRLNDAMRAHLAKFFENELKTCATELGGSAVTWPARYRF